MEHTGVLGRRRRTDISSPTYKNVVTQKVQLFRRAKKHIFKGSLSNEFVLFQNVVSPGSEP